MSVELVTESSDELVHACNNLLVQLSRSALSLSAEQVEDLLAQPALHLFIFRSDVNHKILGMLSLATFTIPTGLRAWVEDVVVSEEARGQGAGHELVKAAVTYAKELGARTVDLTSRPSREAANRLYRRCGFQLRETNVYRISTQHDEEAVFRSTSSLS